MSDTMSFYEQVPKTLEANLRYRIKLRRRAVEDPDFRRAMMIACEKDILFFINAWCWLLEPRPRRDANGKLLPQEIPFITWPHQDEAILECWPHLGERDIGVEKSRGEGASWIAVTFAIHDFLFHPNSKIAFVSKDEASVDRINDSNSLMWKLDFLLEKLPDWMSGELGKEYKRNYSEHTLTNLRNGSSVVGYAATGDVASGGRTRWFLMDELAKFPRGPDKEAMASTEPVTECRFFVSTPKGPDGEYYELMHAPSGPNMVRLTLDWKDNPTRNRGLYRMVDGVPEACDPEHNPLPPEYDPPNQETRDLFSRLIARGFKLEGTVRSPWYDVRCDRPGMTPQIVAQEYDRDYGGSMYRILGNEFHTQVKQTVRPPFVTGVLSYHAETLEPEFTQVENGPVKLWLSLDGRNRPPAHQYVLGADVSTGVGGSYTSNSVVTVIDQHTMEQVLEFAVNTMSPADFADLCMAMGHWMGDAYLSWEHNGPGTAFTKRVLEKRYPNIYRRKSMWKTGGKGRRGTQEAGWWTDTKTKEVMFDELHRSARNGELTLRSEPLLIECGQYVRLNGIIQHVQSASSKDDATRGQAHGDRVIAACVALMAVRDRPLSVKSVGVATGKVLPGTLAERMRIWDAEDERSRNSDDWDDRTSWDMAHPGHRVRERLYD